MCHDNNKTKKRKGKVFKQITEPERYKIEGYKAAKLSNRAIGELLGKDRRTIDREVKSGTIKLRNSDLTEREEYCADVGQRKHDERASNKGSGLKIGNDHDLVKYIENKIINEKYSPDAVLGEIKNNEKLKFKTTICTKTLYNYIDNGLFLNLTNADLPVKKHKSKRGYKKIKISLKNKTGRSIEERPEEVENREEIGDWEMDCVASGRNTSKSALLVLTERKSRLEVIVKMSGQTQSEVEKALNGLENEYGSNFRMIFRTITVDNGSEFIDSSKIEKSCLDSENKRTEVYYAHPYSSFERGSNENANKLIRRFIPKGADIGMYSEEEIKRIECWINNYPRKILNYKTSAMVYEEEKNKSAQLTA